MARKILLPLAALFIAAFAGLVLTKTMPYYTFEKGIHFLTTKSDETNDNPLFRLGFYVHITTSLVVLVLGLLQFLPVLAQRGPGLHRQLGKGLHHWGIGAGGPVGAYPGALLMVGWPCKSVSRCNASCGGCVPGAPTALPASARGASTSTGCCAPTP